MDVLICYIQLYVHEVTNFFLFMYFQIPLLSASIVGYTSVGKAVTVDATVEKEEVEYPNIDAMEAGTSEVSSTTKAVIISVDIRVECIDEERTGLGIGDYADITFLDNDSSDISLLPIGPYEIIRIDNSKSAVLRIVNLSNKGSQIAEQFITQIKAGKATIKKVREFFIILKLIQ